MKHSGPWVLGISSSHNGAACLLKGDEIIAAVQEERLLRHKRSQHPAAEGSLAIQYCLKAGGITASDLNAVVVCSTWPRHLWLDDASLNPTLQIMRNGIPVLEIPHHLGHAIGAFATSGFADAAVLIVDGSGSPWENLPKEEQAIVRESQSQLIDWHAIVKEIISVYDASDCHLSLVEKHIANASNPKQGMAYFQTLGDMFGAIGHQIFGQFFEGPGKVMGLAPYGVPTIPASDFYEIVDDEFIFKDIVPDRFLHNDRWPNRKEEYSNLAASVQAALEAALTHLMRRTRALSRSENFCYAGGVALNSVANEKMIRQGLFKNVFIMPAAEDSGCAIGAAYYGLWQLTGRNTYKRQIRDSVGREYHADEIDAAIRQTPGIQISRPDDPLEEAVDLLVQGKIVGWFHGRSELGPRALGHRSILCDPRRPEMKDVINGKVKFREGFRPFAPVVLLEQANEWFDAVEDGFESPFMLRVLPYRTDKSALVPAVVHVDGTGRVQTVTQQSNAKLYELISRFYARTGVPILLNTSFNIAGEPIVETPEDAIWCFLYTDMDACVIEDTIIYKVPSRHPVLDNILELSALSATLEAPVHNNRLHLPERSALTTPSILFSVHADSRVGEEFIAARFPPEPKLRLVTETPWGKVKRVMDVDVRPILTLLDGKKTARQILREIQRAHPHFTEREFILLIGVLRRISVISLKAQPAESEQVETEFDLRDSAMCLQPA